MFRLNDIQNRRGGGAGGRRGGGRGKKGEGRGKWEEVGGEEEEEEEVSLTTVGSEEIKLPYVACFEGKDSGTG